MYTNKFFNYFIDKFEIEGLEKIQSDYIMRKFWSDGTVAAFPIKHTNEVGFTTYATQKYNMYDWPEIVQLINKWNVPFMPLTPQTVDKDVILGWAQSNHKPIRVIVDYYIDRIVQVEMVINTNLTVNKLPWVIAISPQDKEKAQDILDDIMNDKPVVFANMEDLQMVQSLVNSSPYILDKLYEYKINLENELLTYFGIDNNALSNNTGYQLVDQENSNNAIINLNSMGFEANIGEFFDKINETFGTSIQFKSKLELACSVYDGEKGVPSEKSAEGDEDVQE